MIVDYHMHLRAPDESLDFTVDAVERYVETAAARGVDEIGFTEHVYYFRQTKHLWSTAYHLDHCTHDLDEYVGVVVEAKRRGFPVKLGLEVDYEPTRAEETRQALDPYPWDYLLGSVHFIGDAAIDSEPSLVAEVGVEEAWRQYYEVLAAAANSGLFDSLAHPDLVKFHGGEIAWEWGAVADALDGVCLEVSTAGLHKAHGRMYPNETLLREAHARQIPITLASDAHAPDLVGRDLLGAIEYARGAGYETITVFDRRSAAQVPMP